MSRGRAAFPWGLVAVLAGAAAGLALVVAHALHASWSLALELWEVIR